MSKDFEPFLFSFFVNNCLVVPIGYLPEKMPLPNDCRRRRRKNPLDLFSFAQIARPSQSVMNFHFWSTKLAVLIYWE
jgi:hypothetical protein